MTKRKVDILIISDSHLGTFGAQAKQLIQYLDSVEPSILVINGDLIDIWQYMRWYFPKSHLQVLQRLAKIAASGIPTYYLTGNHDDLLRKFTPITWGNFQLQDEIILDIDGKQTWIFHGDIYDKTIKARTAAIMGGLAYNILIVMDRIFNRITGVFGFRKVRISKMLKDFSKQMAKKVGNFEDAAINMAISKGYDYVICGHIHRPQMREVSNENGSIWYLNSGDWVENASALEYNDGVWKIFTFETDFNTKL